MTGVVMRLFFLSGQGALETGTCFGGGDCSLLASVSPFSFCRAPCFGLTSNARFVEGRDGDLVKVNPLIGWSSEDVWRWLEDNEVPTNPLHAQGFRSIGCEPCTRPVRADQHEREGRWWWEDATKKECGLHRAADAPDE